MLIEFSVENFRSLRSKQTLSMVASKLPDHAGSNTFDPALAGFGRFLRSSAVYGPNAAGKTNLLRALQYVQSLVVNSAAATPGTPPPYSPFKFAKATRDAPSEFQVAFVQNGTRYEYGFAVDAVRILKEWLVEYAHPRGRAIFEREFSGKESQYRWKFSSFLKGQRSNWSEATLPNALFLSTAVQLNSKQLLPVFEWFQKRLVVIAGATAMNPTLTLQTLARPDGQARVLPFLREADLGISGVDVKTEPLPTGAGPLMIVGSPLIVQQPGLNTPNVVRVTLSHASDTEESGRLDISEESAGTQVLFRSAGAWLNVLENGEVLLFDEIDTSLHPLLTRFLIKRFHSGKTNPKNAQLIFSTHNTSFLNQDLFRRDQIWFVEKTPDGASQLYPLSDFKPRNDEAIESWYLRGRYGALPVLDEIQN
jgi:AAA15 family ATPase/GTPase